MQIRAIHTRLELLQLIRSKLKPYENILVNGRPHSVSSTCPLEIYTGNFVGGSEVKRQWMEAELQSSLRWGRWQDFHLLCGIMRHGYGRWDEILGDSNGELRSAAEAEVNAKYFAQKIYEIAQSSRSLPSDAIGRPEDRENKDDEDKKKRVYAAAKKWLTKRVRLLEAALVWEHHHSVHSEPQQDVGNGQNENSLPKLSAASFLPAKAIHTSNRARDLTPRLPESSRGDHLLGTSMEGHESDRRDICTTFNTICDVLQVAYIQIQQGNFKSYSSCLLDVSSRVEFLRTALISYSERWKVS